MGRIAFLTDRAPEEALPDAHSLGYDVKVEPLTADSIVHVAQLAPTVVVVDAEPSPEPAFRLLTLLPRAAGAVPVAVIVGPTDIERFAWERVADELLSPGAPAAETRLRLAMLERRTPGTSDASIRLGPVVLDTETYQVSVDGVPLDLTYKEFELLRFLLRRPGRVFTRGELLEQVWGYSFYGGARTVDVHVRRLRGKLGPEHEALIQTVRGVGYRAADERRP